MIRSSTSRTEPGPYYRPGAPFRSSIADGVRGDRLTVAGRVLGGDGAPLSGAVLDVWQADAEGHYDAPSGRDAGAGWRLRGRIRAGADGTFRFETIRPAPYPVPGGMRPAHIHVIVSAEGFPDLVTELFFEGDPYLENDPAELVRPDLVRPVTRRDGTLWIEHEFCMNA